MDWLLGFAIPCSLLLIVAATATLGRKITDYEYQVVAGINGVRRIQSVINIRSNINRISFGLVYLLTTILALTDMDIVVRTWVSRGLFILLMLFFTGSTLADWYDERRQMRILVKQDQEARKDDSDELQSRRHGVPEWTGRTGEGFFTTESGSSHASDGGTVAP